MHHVVDQEAEIEGGSDHRRSRSDRRSGNNKRSPNYSSFHPLVRKVLKMRILDISLAGG